MPRGGWRPAVGGMGGGSGGSGGGSAGGASQEQSFSFGIGGTGASRAAYLRARTENVGLQ
jgi:hypothetical protein